MPSILHRRWFFAIGLPHIYIATWILSWLLVCCPFLGHAQSPYFHHFDVDHGLPSSVVYHAMQDKQGLMWFSSEGGLSSYDGYQFRNYSTGDGLPANEVLSSHEDSQGRIWILTRKGKPCFVKDGEVFSLNRSGSERELTAPITFLEDSKRNIWIGCASDGIAKIDTTGALQFFNNGEALSFMRLISMWETPQGVISMLSPAGVHSYQNGKWLDPVNIQGSNNLVHPLLVGDSLVLDFRNGQIEILNLLTSQKASINQTKIHPANSLHNYLDSEHTLWIGTSDGVFAMNFGKLAGPPKAHLLHDLHITGICKDKEGGHWFTSEGRGIYYTPAAAVLTYSENNGLITPGPTVSLLAADRSMWLGFEGNLLTQILQGKKNSLRAYEDLEARAQIRVNSLVQIASGEILVCTNRSILIFRSGKFIETGIEGGLAMERDAVGNLYIATEMGLFKIHESDFASVASGKKVQSSTIDIDMEGKITAIKIGADSTLWVGSTTGLIETKGDKTRFWGEQHPALRGEITSILFGPAGEIWVATKASGIACIGNDTVVRYKYGDGLLSNTCNHMHIDMSSNLWVGTNRGLNKATIHEGKIVKWEAYNMSDGLSSNEINHINSQNDTLYLSTARGLTFFNISDQRSKPSTPTVLLSSVSVNGVLFPATALLNLEYRQNDLRFEFTGLSFKASGNLEYRFMLQGADEDWHYTRSRSAEYPALQPGTYTFLVEASAKPGQWSANTARVNITIAPPFWLSFWFLGGAILLGAVLLIGSTRYVQSIAREKEREHALLLSKIEEARLTALRAQMNPHFISNALNSIQLFIVQNNSDSAIEYLGKFAELMRFILNNSKHDRVLLKDELDLLELYMELEAMRANQKFSWEIKVQESIDPERVSIPPMIIQPYIENAIWHGLVSKEGQGHLSLEVRTDGSFLYCSITDDGVGREKAATKSVKYKKGPSRGMEVTAERLKLINSQEDNALTMRISDLKDDAGEGLGTMVELCIPINKKRSESTDR